MKKILALLLSIFALISSVTVFAADGFVSSPSDSDGPTIVTGVISHPNCDARIVVTPYSKRDTLSEQSAAALEAAYTQLTTASLSDLNSDFAAFLGTQGLNDDGVAVSDLFDVDYVGCTLHNTHGSYTVSVNAANLGKFVGLLHNVNGEWEYVDNATVKDGVLTFTVSSLSPFAIVVRSAAAGDKLLYGDVNFDNQVNSIDAAQVLKHDALLIELKGFAPAVGDVNGDGEVNSLDAAQILKYDAYLISVLPMGKWLILE